MLKELKSLQKLFNKTKNPGPLKAVPILICFAYFDGGGGYVVTGIFVASEKCERCNM